MALRLLSAEVLRYTETPKARGTVRRHYDRWREERDPPRPQRCDNPECVFHEEPLVWNGYPLSLILDHKNGNNSDDRPKNLRLLCPNCDSQLPTRGGGNRGKIKKSSGGFAKVRPDGKKDYVLPAESGDVRAKPGEPADLSRSRGEA